jgi:hypothetical protein
MAVHAAFTEKLAGCQYTDHGFLALIGQTVSLILPFWM